MIKKMSLEIFSGGGYFERELVYEGKDLKEIQEQIQQDENALLEYMRTGNDQGEKCFVFQGFMLAKKHIRRAEAWTIIMNDAVNEQHRINKELGNHDQEDEP